MTAAEKILAKVAVGSRLNSVQWRTIQAGLRDRAAFSAQVVNVQVVKAMQRAAAGHADGALDLSEARKQIRQALLGEGYHRPEGQEGTIVDLMSQKRLDMKLKTDVQMARGWARMVDGMSPGAIYAFPAQRLVRVRDRRVPRDWESRWRLAGDRVGWNGASREDMTALKTSPIWSALSIFGNPFPPFDFNSGMGLRDVPRKTAIELGLTTRDGVAKMVEEAREAKPPEFNGTLSVKVEPDEGEYLKDRFGDQVNVEGGQAKWVPDAVPNAIRAGNAADLGGGLTVDPEVVAGLGDDILNLLPSLCRGGRSNPILDLLGGGVLSAIIVGGKVTEVRHENP